MSDNRTDCVELEGGVAHLPAEFRAVARLANQAGLEGWKYLDLDYGLDLEAVREKMKEGPGLLDLHAKSRVEITYEPQRPRTSDREGPVYVEDLEREIASLHAGLEALVKLQAHYAELLATGPPRSAD